MSGIRSAVYSRKRIGPRTDPCGTPHKISVGNDAEACDVTAINNTALDCSQKALPMKDKPG